MRLLVSILLLCASTLATPAFAQFNNTPAALPGVTSSTTFVPVDEAFPFSSFQHGKQVFIDWQVKPGYYLYRHSLSVAGKNITLGDIAIPSGEPHNDEFFGKVNIFTTPLSISVPISDYKAGAQLSVQYQGCAKAGFCYPPETRVIKLKSITAATDTSAEALPHTKAAAAITSSVKPAANLNGLESDSSRYVDSLGHTWWAPLLFLALGIGLAFTPCVLPMYPILTSIVLGQGKLSLRKAFALSFIYVQGMALTYTLLGLLVASAGMQFQAAMQQPAVLISLSVLFVALAFSMFGLYSLQLPVKMQTWLSSLSNQQKSGRGIGVFAMGAISGLVCSPCTTAPLSGALLYVAQTGNLVTGGISLYALAMGMGIPLMLVAVFGNKLLPKAGAWMNHVKVLFGFILLAAPIFLLDRILPATWSTYLWSALGLAAFAWLYHAKNALQFGGWKQSVIGIVAILGILASAQPLLNMWLHPNPSHSASSVTNVHFTKVQSVAELDRQLEKARLAGKPVMLDFYADWCVACKEFDKYTFHNPEVAQQLQHFTLLQVDVTKSLPEDFKLMQKMNVLGLPTIEFWNAKGEHLVNAKVTGFKPAQDFLQHLTSFKLTQPQS